MKYIKILVIIIVILAIIFGIKILGLFEKKEENTLQMIKEIVAKSENINNYSLKLKKQDDKDTIYKYKDGKSVIINNNTKMYINEKDLSEKKLIVSESEGKKIATYVNLIKNEELIKSHREQFNLLLENCEKYEFKSEEKFNGYNCVIVDVEHKYQAEGWLAINTEKYSGKNIKTSVWIDKETGVIMKIYSEIEDIKNEEEYYYEFNCVTDEDVNIPDLSEYEIVESN